jgi:exodeoxyribonuclease V alpha subunit
LRELVLAYAVTVHKSQGSEYPVVIFLCHSTDWWMLSRQIAYTAVTRARKVVVLVGDQKGLRRACRNDQPVQRYTRLASLLAAGGG